MKNWIKFLISGGFIVAIVFCLYLITKGNLSAKETALLSILLTGLSILATWILTHIYSESQHKKVMQEVQETHKGNLKTYALKAAEKVNNLSNQLNLLAVYLQQAVDEIDSDNLKEELRVNRERIGSAIHIIGTLKSVNDTALSDWQGVIGEELEEQREKQTEREEEIRDLLDRLETISESQLYTRQHAQDSTLVLTKEVESLRKDLRSIAISLGLSPIPLSRPITRKKRIVVEKQCPKCGGILTYRQKQRTSSVKGIKCQSCATDLISRYSEEEGFIIEEHRPTTEQITCPSCGNECEVILNILPNSRATVNCEGCNAKITVTRYKSGVVAKTERLTEDTIEAVRSSLPVQPWPKGINKSVAEKLGLSNKLVAEAMKILIQRGIFNPQVSGRIYMPASEKKTKRKSTERKKTESVEIGDLPPKNDSNINA